MHVCARRGERSISLAFQHARVRIMVARHSTAATAHGKGRHMRVEEGHAPTLSSPSSSYMHERVVRVSVRAFKRWSTSGVRTNFFSASVHIKLAHLSD